MQLRRRPPAPAAAVRHQRRVAAVAARRHEPRRDLQHQRRVVGPASASSALAALLGGLQRRAIARVHRGVPRRPFKRGVQRPREQRRPGGAGRAAASKARPRRACSRADSASVSRPRDPQRHQDTASRASPSARACRRAAFAAQQGEALVDRGLAGERRNGERDQRRQQGDRRAHGIASVREQHRQRRIQDQMPGHAAEDHLAQPALRVGTLDDQVGSRRRSPYRRSSGRPSGCPA